jgi:peptide/nickel transport system ATP-binding protein
MWSRATFQPEVNSMPELLEVKALTKHFPVHGGLLGRTVNHVHAADEVSFSIAKGETLSIVGESGCGKSTVGRAVLCLLKPTSGEVWLDGERIDSMSAATLRPKRRHLQAVFQDPFSSLSPRLRVRDILAEPLINFGIATKKHEIDARVEALLGRVGLPRDASRRFPHEFSGGQRQRIAIARALAPEPALIVCDEAVSALDVSVKAQIVNLLKELQAESGLSLLFISHDLAVVEHLTHRVAVMYLGRIVEIAERRKLFATPTHPYTQALLSAVPVPDPTDTTRPVLLEGDVPSPIDPPSGCRFRTRCRYAFDRCRMEEPELLGKNGESDLVACHLVTTPTERA